MSGLSAWQTLQTQIPSDVASCFKRAGIAGITARGVYGQGIYIDPKAEMVIARYASHPAAGNAANDPVTLPAYMALAKDLLAGG